MIGSGQDSEVVDSDLGRALGGAVESGAPQEVVDLLPGFLSRLFDLQEALDLWTGPGPEQVLSTTQHSSSQL